MNMEPVCPAVSLDGLANVALWARVTEKWFESAISIVIVAAEVRAVISPRCPAVHVPTAFFKPKFAPSASLDEAIAALVLISVFTIESSAILELVTEPSAGVTTVPPDCMPRNSIASPLAGAAAKVMLLALTV